MTDNALYPDSVRPAMRQLLKSILDCYQGRPVSEFIDDVAAAVQFYLGPDWTIEDVDHIIYIQGDPLDEIR